MLDFDVLFAPFGQDAPVGQNLEYSPQFDEIKRARESDPDYLPQGEWRTELRKADWSKVVKLSSELIAGQSKDLRLVCWLAEGLCHQKGEDGLQQGIELVIRWIEDYWETGWPALKDDGVVMRHSILVRFDKDVSTWLSTYPFFLSRQGAPSHWCAVQTYKRPTSLTSRANEVNSTGVDYSREAYHRWAATLDPHAVRQTQVWLEGLLQLLRVLDSICLRVDTQAFTPVLTHTGSMLETLKNSLNYLQDWSPISDVDTLPRQELEAVTDISPLGATNNEARMTRQSAIRQMHDLASFFRQTEPSSPVPFLLERAARWADMSLNDWLQEMLKDEGSLKNIHNVLRGIDCE